jgi:NADH-quinone oxidoreductase subunit K
MNALLFGDASTGALFIAAIIFVTGLMGVLARRNTVVALLSIEIMLNAAGLAFIAAGSKWRQSDGQIMFLFILTASAAEGALGLALILRQRYWVKNLDIDAMDTLGD